jgi:rare lipoprotein A
MVIPRSWWSHPWRARLAFLALPCLLAACASTPTPSGGSGGTMAPYQVNGVWYRPREQPDYDAVGVATWYGPQYHDRRTADGEVFDMDRPSAAHPTLPLPCIVEVTNLDNGQRIRVRVNDRGPFAPGRIIDLSRQAAKDLGVYQAGSARVRVRYVGPAPVVGERGGGGLIEARLETPPAPPPSPAASPGARVQAGVFADRGNAERAAARFADGGANIEAMDRGGARLWRVVVVGAPGESVRAVRDRVIAAGFDPR